MARIYISYSDKDKELTYQLAQKLRNYGQEIIIDTEELTPGIDWRSKMSNALKMADGVIAIITEHSLTSQFVLTEIGQARAYTDKFLIPIIFGDIPIPPVIQDIQCLIADPNDLNSVVNTVIKAIGFYDTKQKIEQEKEAKKIEKIETNASEYVEAAMEKLGQRESRNKLMGNIWYTLGFICLFSGVVFGVLGIKGFLRTEKIEANIQWPVVIILAIKSTVIIGLLIACSKYSFTLGKSYTNEALKNADRSHAISFGKFYLDAYGASAKWDDLKEAFQYWNINNESSFSKLDTNQYDPKFVELVVELSKIISTRNDKK